jgi:hypothetical protein
MKPLIIALLIVLPAIGIAQPNYQPGYVLTSNGDTLKGFINYREWAYCPSSFEFKLSQTSNDVRQFNPGTVKGFGIAGAESYTSFVGLISMNKNIFPDIPTSLDTTRQPGEIFLKQLTTGNHITLYLNNEVGKNRFFIAGKNEAPVELKYYEYYGASKSDEVIDNLYRGQLILYVYRYNNGDKKLLSAIAEVKFEERDLKDIVDEINNIVSSDKADSLQNANEKSIVRPFAGTGLNSINSSGQHIIRPRFDFGIDVFRNPDIQQFIFRTEIAFSSFGTHFTRAATTNSVPVDVSYAGAYITITPQFLFNVFNKENFKAYIDGGFGFRIVSYTSNDSNGTLYVDNSPTGFYIPLQAGVVINKRFEISFTYTSLTTSASYSGEVGVSDKLSTTLGLKLFLY